MKTMRDQLTTVLASLLITMGREAQNSPNIQDETWDLVDSSFVVEEDTTLGNTRKAPANPATPVAANDPAARSAALFHKGRTSFLGRRAPERRSLYGDVLKRIVAGNDPSTPSRTTEPSQAHPDTPLASEITRVPMKQLNLQKRCTTRRNEVEGEVTTEGSHEAVKRYE